MRLFTYLSNPNPENNIFSFSKDPATTSTSDENYHQYNIAPSLNKKQSIPANHSKKLTPKKYGIFSTSFETMEGSNTAGEAVDDLLRAGNLGNLDDSFSTLEQLSLIHI